VSLSLIVTGSPLPMRSLRPFPPDPFPDQGTSRRRKDVLSPSSVLGRRDRLFHRPTIFVGNRALFDWVGTISFPSPPFSRAGSLRSEFFFPFLIPHRQYDWSWPSLLGSGMSFFPPFSPLFLRRRGFLPPLSEKQAP